MEGGERIPLKLVCDIAMFGQGRHTDMSSRIRLCSLVYRFSMKPMNSHLLQRFVTSHVDVNLQVQYSKAITHYVGQNDETFRTVYQL